MSTEKTNFLQKDISLSRPFGDKVKMSFYNEFSSLLESGIDIQRALQILIEEQQNKKANKILTQISDDLVKGASLAEALQKSKYFTMYEIQSVRIGEETGRLQIILEQLAVFFENKVKLKRQLIGVFTYPTFVILITIGVLYFMLTSVVPMFEDVFKQFGQELPSLTQKIIGLSRNFSTILLYVVSAIVLLLIYGYTQRKEDSFRNVTSQIVMRIPVFGSLVQKIYLARMCQSMSLLLSSKTPIVNTLELVEEMIGFYPIEKALKSLKADLLKGELLNTGMKNFSIFDSRLISLVKIAEEVNQLDRTFERLSKQYQEDVEYKSKLLGTVIEPLIIVVIGLIVGVIMVAMYMPMFNLSNVIK